MANTEIQERERAELEAQFKELFDRAQEIYPNINESLLISKNFNESGDEINEYINLLNQNPQQISSNQFTVL